MRPLSTASYTTTTLRDRVVLDARPLRSIVELLDALKRRSTYSLIAHNQLIQRVVVVVPLQRHTSFRGSTRL